MQFSILVKLLIIVCLLQKCVQGHGDHHKCSAAGNSCEQSAIHDKVVTGFSVFKAKPIDHESFKQELATMVPLSRAEPGVVSYHMYQNPLQPGTFGFVESWKDTEALDKHLKGPNVQGVFAQPYYNHLRSADPQLFGPWFEVAPAKSDDKIDMTFYWNVDCPKKKVWDIITDWSNASWVMGNPKTELIDAEHLIHRRIFDNGISIKVRLISKNQTSWTTVEETLGDLPFPDVTYSSFFVTITLSDEGVDPDTQTRIRYQTTATVSRGTIEQGRETLKADFYGPRVKYYQGYFNCSRGVIVKNALHAIENLHKTLRSNSGTPQLRQSLAPFFALESDSKQQEEGIVTSLDSFFQATVVDTASTIDVKTPIPLFVLPDLRVVAVEDIVATSLLEASVQSRIVIYQLNDVGKIVSARVFDQSVAENNSINNNVAATYHYFDVLTFKDIQRVRQLFAPDAVLEDPVGFLPPRDFDSVYSHFYDLQKSFVYERSPHRTYVWKNQVAQLVVAKFVLNNGQKLEAFPIQVFTFNDRREITHFEAFFKPSVIDFSKF